LAPKKKKKKKSCVWGFKFFGAKISYEKQVRKTLMKLTAGWFFALLGSACVKAASKIILVKVTLSYTTVSNQEQVSISSTLLRTNFLYERHFGSFF
jgi:hypothetical protein